MTAAITNADPAWAWSPFTPTADAPWDRKAAAHLYRRAAFGAPRSQLQAALEGTPQAAVTQLVEAQEPAGYRDEQRTLLRAMVHTGEVRNLAAAWLHRMLSTPHPLQERMTLFWHGHFATSAAKVEATDLMQAQNDLLRAHATGRFSALVHGISRDVAMLLYLDSATNRKSHPNENYARELLELFCLGEGHYTETDIRELARCFTGWHVKRQRFHFHRYSHDPGEKTIFGRRAALGGEEAVDWVLAQKPAAQLVAAKLVELFVCDEMELPARLLEPLAQNLRDHDYELAPVLKRILGSQLFFSTACRARKIRSPVDLACGLLRAMEGTTNTVALSELCGEVGQALYYPPNVNGWDGGRNWINSATLLGRANLVHEVLHQEKTRFAGDTLETWRAQEDISSSAQLLTWLEDHLLATPLPRAIREQLPQRQVGSLDDAQARELIHLVLSTPEAQLA